jgi:YfiH family protein
MKTVHAPNGVVYITSELIPCINAFSTRVGGVSAAPHAASLNLAFGRGDDDATVLRNLELFGEASGFEPRSVISLRQIHSAEVRTVSSAERGLGYYIKSDSSCDGYATSDRGVTLGVRTADCVPILLCAVGGDGVAYAAAALHAGWRGTVLKIAAAGVSRLVSLGAKEGDIRAAIGPAIGKCCFEIGPDVRDVIYEKLGEKVCAEYVLPSGTASGKWHADLREINRNILLSCGVKPGNIDVSDLCTCCSAGLFYSHRRDGDARGTMLSVISLSRR